jgi:peptidoglycan hydrolase-like amidase
MTVQADPWDSTAAKNPRLVWTDSVPAAALQSRCRGAGDISAVRVLAREGAGAWGGRISRMEILGTSGTCTLASDSAIRAALGVNSSFLTFTA